MSNDPDCYQNVLYRILFGNIIIDKFKARYAVVLVWQVQAILI